MNEPYDLKQRLRDFTAARDWEQFHTPKNLAMALVAEADVAHRKISLNEKRFAPPPIPQERRPPRPSPPQKHAGISRSGFATKATAFTSTST